MSSQVSVKLPYSPQYCGFGAVCLLTIDTTSGKTVGDAVEPRFPNETTGIGPVRDGGMIGVVRVCGGRVVRTGPVGG